MSQLTFEGFTPKSEENAPESWYKGRVLSHSSIGMYRQCPQRWKFRYIDKVPEKPRSFFSFGKSVHTGLEFLFQTPAGPLPTLDAVLEHYKTNWLREGYETAAQEKWFYQEGERILRGFYAKHQSDHRNVFQIEYKFNIAIEGVPLTGYIDRIDATPSGGLAILDYKTGKPFDKSRVRNDAQLTLYQIACQQVFQKPVETVTLYHLNSLTPLTVPAHSKTMENELKAGVVEAAQGIAAEKFDPKPEERGHCQWCDYMQICPAFAGKKIPVAGSSSSTEIADKADRLGKLDQKIDELMMEREELESDIGATLRATGKDQAQGRHFSVKLEKAADGSAERLSSAPLNSSEAN